MKEHLSKNLMWCFDVGSPTVRVLIKIYSDMIQQNVLTDSQASGAKRLIEQYIDREIQVEMERYIEKNRAEWEMKYANQYQDRCDKADEDTTDWLRDEFFDSIAMWDDIYAQYINMKIFTK